MAKRYPQVELDPSIPAWERQRDQTTDELEPNLWFDRFVRFLLLGPGRSLLATYNQERERAGKSGTAKRTARSWDDRAYQWHWRKRAEAKDADDRRKLLDADEGARREMLDRHTAAGQAMQALASRYFAQILKDHLEDLAPGQARLLLMDGIRTEREAMGLPKHLMELTLKSTDDLLADYANIVRRLTDPGSDQS